MPLSVDLVDTIPPPVYQAISVKALHLHDLGLSNAAIARSLSVTGKTVAKAIAWARGAGLTSSA